jgi:vacuolar-type H+-ATPase subunit H
MATTNIELDIENITGVSDADDQYIISAQKFVVASVPKELLKWSATLTSPSSHGGNTSQGTSVVMPTATDSILDVSRNGFSANEVQYDMKGFIANSSSLHLATNTYPKYYLDNAVTDKGTVVIVKPAPTDSATARVLYVDYSKIDDDCDLRNAVIFHAAAQEFEKLASSKIVDWSDLTVPIVPSLTSVSFTSIDSAVDANSPVFTTATVASGSTYTGSAPSYIPPVINPPNFTDADTWINTEEDSEMLASRVQVIGAQISEFQANIQDSVNKFNQENVAFQAQVQESMQEIQVANQVNIAKAQSDLQLALSNADRSQQRQLQNAIQDMQAIVSDNEKKLSKFQAEIVGYQNEVSEKAQKINSGAQNATHYSNQAKKYYEWALNEINMYIQNNSKIIGSTIAAQTAQQRR